MASASAEQWYALQVRHNCENLAAAWLRDLGIVEYLPVQSATLATKTNVTRQHPLFPGYVFCLTDLNVGPKIYTVPYVIRIVGYGKHPTPIEEAEIEAIRSIVSSCARIEPVSFITTGKRIRLTAGPLTGISGIMLEAAGNKKLVVSLPLLQRSLAVRIPVEWATLEPAAS